MELRALLSAMGRSKTGPLLVAAQVALTLAILVNVAYVIHQRLEDAGRPTGLDLANSFWVITQPIGTAPVNPMAAVKTDLAYLNGLPGVIAAAAINPIPQTWSSTNLPFSADPKVIQTPGGGETGTIFFGSERLLDALGVKLVAGRSFSPGAVQLPQEDGEAAFAHWAPEVIVTRALASKLFPGNQALGRTLHAGLINKPAVIVGIVDLMRSNPLPARYDFYASDIVFAPIINTGPNGSYLIRTRPGRRDAVMARVDKELTDLVPGRFISRIQAMDVTAENARADGRITVLILAVAACLVLLVTVVGIVGLAAFNVASRTRQLGTRRALGARRFHILRYFLVENWLITTAGVTLGCLLALLAGLELSRMFQTPLLPLYYLLAGVLLMWAIGQIAVLFPALRAASIPPATATRSV